MMKVKLCKHIVNRLLGNNEKIVAYAPIRFLYKKHTEMFRGIGDLRFCVEEVARKPDKVIVLKDAKGKKYAVKADKRLNEAYTADIILRKKNGKYIIFHANKKAKKPKKEQQ